MTARRLLLRAGLVLGALLAAEILLRVLPVRALTPRVAPVRLEPYLMFGTLPLDPAYRAVGMVGGRPAFGEILPPKKPGEVRVVVLGGSVAYGTGASRRDLCWDRRLEALLPKGWKVVNRARPSYNSTQCLVSLALEALDDEPDWILLVDGFNDLAVPLVMGGRPGDPYYLPAMREQMEGGLWRELRWHSRILQALSALLSEPSPERRSLEPDESASVRRIASRNVREMGALLDARGVQGLFVAEPVSCAKPMSAGEKAHFDRLAWGEALKREYPPLVTAELEAARASGWQALDATGLFADVPATRFADCVHPNDEGQEALARRIASELAPSASMRYTGTLP